jgi:SNF2 family DNA or RNA helicase
VKHPLSEYQFRDRFSRVEQTPYGDRVVGSRNTDQLREMIKPGFERRTKADVFHDFPLIRYVTTPIPLPSAIPQPWNGDTMQYVNDDDLLMHLEALTAADPGSPLATARRVLGLRKVRPVLDWIDTWMMDNDPADKLIVFATHRDVLDALYRAQIDQRSRVPAVVMIDGRTSPQNRAYAVEVFQHHPTCRLFLGQIVAAGEVITLTAASTVAIAEAEFVPARIAQAAARAHRIGQHNAVLVHLLSVPDSLDMRVNRIAARKAQELSGLFETSQGKGNDADADDETHIAQPRTGD